MADDPIKVFPRNRKSPNAPTSDRWRSTNGSIGFPSMNPRGLHGHHVSHRCIVIYLNLTVNSNGFLAPPSDLEDEMVPEEGIEPSRPYGQGILSQLTSSIDHNTGHASPC
jgi:hypothetical protein